MKMTYSTYGNKWLWLLLLLLLMLLVATVCTLPTRGEQGASRLRRFCGDNDDNDDEDCRDEHMHPQLANEERQRRQVNLADEQTSAYWLGRGVQYVAEKAASAEQPPRQLAKNIVYMVGDGLSLTTTFATRVYLGGEQMNLTCDAFPDAGLARTYTIDTLVADSASTATALLGGVKTRYGTLGVSGRVRRGDCAATRDSRHHVPNIALWALRSGKSVGVVTTTSLTDATPAALYAHSAERNWRNDADVLADCGSDSDVPDIAAQLLSGEVGRQLSVMLGGGRGDFIDGAQYAAGRRVDGRNLIAEFVSASPDDNVYVATRAELLASTSTSTSSPASRLWGMFADNDFDYAQMAPSEQPTLEEMTAVAVERLARNPNGYLLFVEGGLIDSAHHATRPRLALAEAVEFDKAVRAARTMTAVDDTLIVVTADHSHTMTVAGYAPRSNDIFDQTHGEALDATPYLSLSYANGPSAADYFAPAESRRRHPDEVLTGALSDAYPATVPMAVETHDAEDVAVYASGPWSHLFSGAYEQSTLPYLLAYAACLGDGLNACDN